MGRAKATGAPEGSVLKYYLLSTKKNWLAAFCSARTLILFYESTTLFTERDSIDIPKSFFFLLFYD